MRPYSTVAQWWARVPGMAVTQPQVIDLLQRIDAGGFDIIKTEHLYTFDGKPGFSLGQGQ